MAALKEKGIALLSSTSGVDMKTAGSTTLYNVPADKVAYIVFVVIRDTTASLASGTDYDFTEWKQNVDLSSLTTLGTDYIVLYGGAILDADPIKYKEQANSATFQITVATGAAASGTATIDVFGYLV